MQVKKSCNVGNRTVIRLSVFVAAILMVEATLANPVLDNVAAGQVSVQQSPNTTVVNQSSQKAILNWQSFNIGAAEKTHFQQPAGGIALNRINPNQGASQIYGQLTATGKIILVNQAGIYFGPTARVDVGGIIASTSDISDTNFLAGKYHFDQASAYNGSVINEGKIRAAQNGLVALIGTGVRNDGTIEARTGSVVLASGNKFTVDLSGDGLVNFTVDEATPSAGVDRNGNKLKDAVSNTGVIVANGGTIIMTARTARGVVDNAINMRGVAQAHSVSQRNGTIILDGGDGNVRVAGRIDVSGKHKNTRGGTVKILAGNVHLEEPTVIDASGYSGGGTVLIGGNYQGKGPEQNAYSTQVDKGVKINADAIQNGNGGKVIVWADHDTAFHGSISARGGLEGGDGGFVETSGHYLDVADAKINLLAPYGTTGTWLLDPENLTIQTTGPTTATFSSNTYTSNVDNSILTVTDLQNELALANILVVTGSGGTQAGDITIANSITWSNATKLTISAFRNITVNSGVTISNPSGGSITLQANNKAAFAVGSGDGIVTNNGTFTMSGGGAVVIHYTPISYTTPVSYTNTGTDPVTAYMVVNDVNDLENINQNLSGSYVLNQRIDASATSGWNAGAGFIPIGTNATPFTGRFEGDNHTIVNLYVNNTALDNVGLFGATSNATLADVGLVSPIMNGHQNVGGIVGLFSGGALTIAYISGGSISGVSNVGGLIGMIQSGTVSNLANFSSDVSASSSVAGGIAGVNKGTIQTSYSQGYVTAGSSAGGLVGNNNGGTGTTTFSYWDTQTSGQLTSAGGTGDTTSVLQAAIPFGFSSSIWHILAGISYPYLTNFNSNLPRILSGTAPVSGGSKLLLANNGSQIDSAYTGANNYFYFQERNGTIGNSSPYLIYLSGASTVGNILGLAAPTNGSTTALSLIPNVIQINTASTGFSTTDMATAAGSLSDANILYSLSGSVLTLGNSTNPNVTLQTSGTGAFTISNIIHSTGTTTGLDFNTPVIIDTTDVTTTGSQIYHNAVTLGASSLTTLTSSGANGITFDSTLDGPQGLSIGNNSGSLFFDDLLGASTSLASLFIGTGDTTTINTTGITTSGSQTYESAVNLGGGSLTTLTSVASNISLNNTLTGGTRSLVLTGGTGGDHQFALTDVISIGSLSINGNSAVANTIDFSGYVVPILLTLSAPTSGNVLDSGTLVTNSSSPIGSFQTIQTAIGTNTGQSILVLPDVSGISVTYTNHAHTSGIINDPFYFINFVIANPPPTPEPGPSPTPIDINNLISGTTPFIVNNRNMDIINNGLDEFYDYFGTSLLIDIKLTKDETEVTNVVCHEITVLHRFRKECQFNLLNKPGLSNL